MWRYNKTDNLPGNSLYHNTDELYHYGILGMRWGHRKKLKETKLNKYDKEYNSLIRKYTENDPRTKQAYKMTNEINAYEKKHLSYYGKGSQKAKEKIFSMRKKHHDLISSIEKDAVKQTNETLKNKYGEKKIKQIGKQNTVKSLITFGGAILGTAAIVKLTSSGIKHAGKAIINVSQINFGLRW